MSDLVTFKSNLSLMIERDELALPPNVSVEAFRNAAIIAVQDNPKIFNCTNDSVFKSLRRLAAAGLVPDGREAALVPFKARIDGNYVDVCQAMPMVFGLIKMARRSGTIADIRAHTVYQKELDEGRFEYVIGDEERLTHNPILFGEKGPMIAAYAIARQTDGTIVREFMDAASIDMVRRASAAQRVYEKGQAARASDEPIGIWKDWAAEMWKKTVIRRLCKRLDMSSEDVRHLMDADEFEALRDVTPPETRNPTAFQRKVAEARGNPLPEPEPSQPEDATEIDYQPPPMEHWTASQDTSGAFPGGDEWGEGGKAAKAGMKRTMCPHDEGSQEAIDWLGGYDKAKPEDQAE